jgi:class 3 adenylate cyclase
MSEGRRERKVVSILFADLVGFTSRAESLDPEDVEAILRPYHERLRSELERRGGTSRTTGSLRSPSRSLGSSARPT